MIHELLTKNYCKLTTGNWQLYSTLVEDSLQIRPFMQNKANFRKSQMNVNKALTKNYEQMDTWSIGKNKANTNPIQTQFKANSKPKQTQYKPKQTQFQRQNNAAAYDDQRPAFYRKLKKDLDVAVTASAKSGRSMPLRAARNFAVWTIRAGSFILCFRIGSGDIYGQSVSSINLSSGTSSAACRIDSAFLKVTTPVKEI